MTQSCVSVERWLWTEKGAAVIPCPPIDASIGKEEAAGMQEENRDVSSCTVVAVEKEQNVKTEPMEEDSMLCCEKKLAVSCEYKPHSLVGGTKETAVSPRDSQSTDGGRILIVAEEQCNFAARDSEAVLKVQSGEPDGVTTGSRGDTEEFVVQCKDGRNLPCPDDSPKENIDGQSQEIGCSSENICSGEQITKSPSSCITGSVRYNDAAEPELFSQPCNKQSQSAISCLSSGKQCSNNCEAYSEKINKSKENTCETSEKYQKTSEDIVVGSEQFKTATDRGSDEEMMHKCHRNRLGSDRSPAILMEKDLAESSKNYNSVNLCNESQERDSLKCCPASDSAPPINSSVSRDLKHPPVERDSDSPRSSENARHSGRHSKPQTLDRSSRSSERNSYKDRSHRSSKKGSKHDREYSRSCEKSPKSPEVSRRRSKKRSDSRDRCSREWRQTEGSRDNDSSVKRDRPRSKTRHTDRHRFECYHRADLQQTESTHNSREDRHRRRDQERTRLRRHDSDTRHGRLSRSGCDDDRYTQRGYHHDRHFPRSSSQHSQTHSRGYLCDDSPDGDPRVWPHPLPPHHNPCSPCGGSGHPTNLAEVPRWSQANGKHPTKRSQADGQSADDPSVATVTSEPLPPGLDADTDRCVVVSVSHICHR